MLRVENLSKIFRTGNEEVVVFENINFEVRPGEFIALTGESGSGKTTLLHLLAALDTPTRGEVYFFGDRIAGFSAQRRAVYRNEKIGFVWQLHHLLPEFTALENTMMPSLIAGKDFQQAQGRARELLEEVGLGHATGRRVGELSGGERQRVAVARALINHPPLLLADEPTGSLDPRTAECVADLLQKLHRNHGLTSVLATHNAAFAQRADRTVRLADGALTEMVVPGIR